MKYSLVFIQIVFLAVIFQNDISNAKRILHNKKSINKLEGFLKRLFEEDSNFEGYTFLNANWPLSSN